MFLSRQSSSSYSGYGIPYPPRNPAPLRPPRYPGPYAQPPQPSYGAPPLSSVRFYGRSFSWTPTGGAQSSRISGVYEPDGGLLSRRGGYDEGRDPRGDHHEDRNPFPSSGRPPSPRRGSTQPYSDDDFGRSGAHHDPHLSGGPNHSHSHHRRSGPRSHSVPPSVFSERERRPYGGLLESAPRGQSASRGRNMRSDGYDDPPPPKVRKTSKWRTLGNQRARTSSPPAIKTENLRPDAYDGGPRAPNVRETSRWRSFGRSRPSPQPPLPTIRGREMGSDRYNDGRHQTYPNGKRRHFGFRRSPAPRASPPAQSAMPRSRSNRTEHFESRFVDPVRRRLNRFSSGPTGIASPTPRYPPVGDYVRHHRHAMERNEMRDRPNSNRTSGILDIDGTHQHRRGRPLSNVNEWHGDEVCSSPNLEEMRARLDRLRY